MSHKIVPLILYDMFSDSDYECAYVHKANVSAFYLQVKSPAQLFSTEQSSLSESDIL